MNLLNMSLLSSNLLSSNLINSNLLKKPRKYVATLPEKDQRALKLLALFCTPLLVYFLLLEPSYHYYSEAKNDYLQGRELLTWIEQNKTRIPDTSTAMDTSPSNAQGKLTRELPLSQFVSSAAEARKIGITRLQPQGENGVRIWMNDVSFASLIAFLTAVSDNRFNISTIAIDKTNTPGIVNAQCLITS